MGAKLIEGLLTGLANNLFCLGTCLPVMLPYMLSDKRKQTLPVLEFLAGRFTAYICFGILSGMAGIYFDGRLDPRIFGALTIILSLWIILFAAGKLEFGLKPCAVIGRFFTGKHLPLFAGFVMGINICPPFLLGLSRAMEMKSVIMPVVYFTGFFAGSSLWLLIFLFTGKLTDNAELMKAGQLAALLAGFWFLAQGISNLI